MGIIFDIKHYAIHDGPGIRTTVFMKGCPLGCWWCHNPESRSAAVDPFIRTEKVGEKIIEIEEVAGKHMSAGQVMKEIEKDRVLFEESKGGVTFSGGEPFQQFDFLEALLQQCHEAEIHTCIDTSGYTTAEQLEKSAGLTGLYLYDLKQLDDEKHRKYTGVSNKLILENLRLLDNLDQDIEIRYPLIPGMNDDESDLLRLMAFLSKLKNKYPVSILPYHKIGSHKYSRFSIDYRMEGVEEPSKEHIENIKNTIENAGFVTKIGG